jgi:thioredoxin-related protein
MILVVFFNCAGDSNETIAQNKAENIKRVSVTGKTDNKNFSLGFNDGLEKAVKENKNMLVDFYTDWCHWCKVMDEKTFNDKNISAKLNDRFISVRLNAESSSESVKFKGQTFTNMELTRAFRVTGFPSLAFISPQQEVITVIPGYIPAEQFGYILDYIDKECYKKQMSLDEFIKKKGECDKPTAIKK